MCTNGSRNKGYETFIITDSLKGDTETACSFIINEINSHRSENDFQKRICLLFGGETTVKVTGEGAGGRNQHLALYTAFHIKDIPGTTFLSAGPTEMTGIQMQQEQ